MTHLPLTGWQAQEAHASLSSPELSSLGDRSVVGALWGSESAMAKAKGEGHRASDKSGKNPEGFAQRGANQESRPGAAQYNPAPNASPPSAPSGVYGVVKSAR